MESTDTSYGEPTARRREPGSSRTSRPALQAPTSRGSRQQASTSSSVRTTERLARSCGPCPDRRHVPRCWRVPEPPRPAPRPGEFADLVTPIVAAGMEGNPHPRSAGAPPSRRIAFTAWAAILVVLYGVGFFGLTTLVIGWFETRQGVAGPVTDLGYGALVGIIQTMGLMVQLRAPERKIAGMQQAALVIPALLIGLLASLKPHGWRIPAWCAGMAVVVYGLASVVFPDHPGAEERGWGSLAIAGGVLFIAAAEWEAKRASPLS